MRCGGKGDAIPLLVFQDAPPFKAGSFTHIDDVADCYIFAITHCDKMINDKVYNVGNSALNHSKKEIAEIIKQRIDYQIVESEIKDKDLRHFVMDFDRIGRLGYVPKKTVLDGVDELIKLFSFYEYKTHYNVI